MDARRGLTGAHKSVPWGPRVASTAARAGKWQHVRGVVTEPQRGEAGQFSRVY